MSHLQNVGMDIAHEAGVDTVDCAEAAFKFLFRRLRWIVGGVAGEIRGKGREDSVFICLVVFVDDLRRTLEGDRGDFEFVSVRSGEWRF